MATIQRKGAVYRIAGTAVVHEQFRRVEHQWLFAVFIIPPDHGINGHPVAGYVAEFRTRQTLHASMVVMNEQNIDTVSEQIDGTTGKRMKDWLPEILVEQRTRIAPVHAMVVAEAVPQISGHGTHHHHEPPIGKRHNARLLGTAHGRVVVVGNP